MRRKRPNIRPDVLICIAIMGLLVWLLGIYWVTGNNERGVTHTIKQKIQFDLYPTPTIISSKNGWNIYQYPDKRKPFTFEYPADWQVTTLHEVDDMPTVKLHYKKNGHEYNIVLNTTHYAEYKRDNYITKKLLKKYGEKTVSIHIISLRNKVVGVSSVFENVDETKDPIQTVSIDLIVGDSAIPLRVFDHILSTLEYK